MNREFFINIIFLVVVNVLIKPFFIFGIDRNVQNLVGEKEYGIYFTIYSFTVMFQILTDLGIQNFNSREISQNSQLLDKYFSNIIVLKTGLAVLYIVILTFMAVLFQYEIALFPLILYLGINQILFNLLGYLRSNIAALGFYRMNSILTVLDRLILIFVCAILLWVEPFRSHFEIMWFVHAQNFSIFITCLIALFIVFKKIKTFKFSIKIPEQAFILRGALPFALAIFLMTLYTRTDVVMMERMLPDGDRQAGIYASAYRLLDAVNMVGYMFAGLLLPMFSRLLKSGDGVTSLLRFSYQLLLCGSVTLAVSTWFYRVDIMHLLYKEATPYSGDVLGSLMFSFVAVSGTYIYSTLLNASGNVSKMNRIFIIAIVVNIGLNFMFIPYQKALGAAVSTLLTQFFVMGGMMYLARKILVLKGDTKWALKISSFIVSAFIINFIVKNIDFISIWYLQFGISMFLCFLSALFLGFFNYKKLEGLLSFSNKNE